MGLDTWARARVWAGVRVREGAYSSMGLDTWVRARDGGQG